MSGLWGLCWELITSSLVGMEGSASLRLLLIRSLSSSESNPSFERNSEIVFSINSSKSGMLLSSSLSSPLLSPMVGGDGPGAARGGSVEGGRGAEGET